MSFEYSSGRKVALRFLFAALIAALFASIAAIAPATSAAAQDGAAFACSSDAGAISWTGSADDAGTHWIYRSTDGGEVYRWLGKAAADNNMIIDPAPRPGVLYQVHYRGIPRTGCATVSEPAPTECTSGTSEAETATLAGRFVTGTDNRASGGAYAHVPRGTGGEWNGARTNFVEFCLTVDEPGIYRIDARLLAPSSIKRSFYVTMDDGILIEFVAPAVVGQYQTVAVNEAGVLDPLNASNRPDVIDEVTWDLAAGDHYVRFSLRRDGTQLDNITLSRTEDPPPEALSPQEKDANAVRAIYATNNLSISSGNVCDRRSVTCDNDDRVTRMDPYFDGDVNVLPPEIGDLTELASLRMTSPRLTELPAEFANLTKLKDLFVYRSALTEVPSEVTNLTNLRILHLNDSQISELPPEIGNLTNLKSLSFKGSRLTAVPPEIGNLILVTELRLDENELTELPPEIGDMLELTYLDVYDNQLAVLPPELARLDNLFALRADRNRLTELPVEIGDIAAVEWLFLGNNQLTDVPPEIANLSNLTRLALDNNQLTTLPPLSPAIEYLGADRNQFTSVPLAITTLTNLGRLSLANNQIRGDITALEPLISDPSILISIGDGNGAQTLGDGEGGNDCMTTTSADLAAYLDRVDPEWSRCDAP